MQQVAPEAKGSFHFQQIVRLEILSSIFLPASALPSIQYPQTTRYYPKNRQLCSLRAVFAPRFRNFSRSSYLRLSAIEKGFESIGLIPEETTRP